MTFQKTTVFETNEAVVEALSPKVITIRQKTGRQQISIGFEGSKVIVKVWGINTEDVIFQNFTEDHDFPPAFSFEI